MAVAAQAECDVLEEKELELLLNMPQRARMRHQIHAHPFCSRRLRVTAAQAESRAAPEGCMLASVHAAAETVPMSEVGDGRRASLYMIGARKVKQAGVCLRVAENMR